MVGNHVLGDKDVGDVDGEVVDNAVNMRSLDLTLGAASAAGARTLAVWIVNKEPEASTC